MGSATFTRPATEVEVDGVTITKRISLKKDLSGNLVKFVEFVEDDDNKSVTNRVLDSDELQTTINQTIEISANLVVEDLSSQLVVDSPGPYTLSAEPKSNTLTVYLNGVLINDEISVTSNTFTIINNYEEAIYSGSSLYAVYIEEA
jgi:hypothetical protein